MNNTSKRALIILLQEFRDERDAALAKLVYNAKSNLAANKYYEHERPHLDRIDQVIRHVQSTMK